VVFDKILNMNIVLTGFMATGKTEIGMSLAKKLNMNYIDTDCIIEEKENMPVREIFSSKGEKYFRDLECSVAVSSAGLDNCVISTGGGMVLRKENMDNLRKNAKIVNLYADVDKILERVTGKSDRPLLNVSNKREEIVKLFESRKSCYENCDISVDTTNTVPCEAADKIIKLLGL